MQDIGIKDSRALFRVLYAALAILLLLRLTSVGDFLLGVPVVGASIPFFLLSIGALIWRIRSGEPASTFGIARPESWSFVLALAIAAVGAKLIVFWIFSYFAPEAEVNLSRLDPIRGNLGTFLWVTPAVWLIAGFGEELLHRGFILSRLAVFLGKETPAWTKALAIQAVLFGAGHLYQGVHGALLSTISALIFGGLYLWSGRNLWASVIAHSLGNTIPLVEAYGSR